VFTFPAYTYGALPDGNYHASLVGATDLAGNPLVAGAGFDFFVLPGDTNLDRSVNFADLVALSQHYNTSGGMLWSNGDFTADGNVDFADLVILSQHYNTTLPQVQVVLTVDPGSQQALASGSLLKQTTQAVFNTEIPITRPAVTRKVVLRKPR
jgi:hypothetical protein